MILCPGAHQDSFGDEREEKLKDYNQRQRYKCYFALQQFNMLVLNQFKHQHSSLLFHSSAPYIHPQETA